MADQNITKLIKTWIKRVKRDYERIGGSIIGREEKEEKRSDFSYFQE